MAITEGSGDLVVVVGGEPLEDEAACAVSEIRDDAAGVVVVKLDDGACERFVMGVGDGSSDGPETRLCVKG